MKLRKIFVSALLVSMPMLGFAQAIETTPSGYSLRWSDEFNGTELNMNNWNYETGNGNWGFGNGELEYYTNRPENIKVADGKLTITAKREDYNGFKFTSARINGNNKAYFKHGIMQAKIKFPKTADGLWPAYWMMGNNINKYGWPKCGEMDIVEMGFSEGIKTGFQDRHFAGTLHWGPNNAGHLYTSQDFGTANNNYKGKPMSDWPVVENDNWHVITVEWTGEKCKMYLDLEKYNNAGKNKAVFASFDIPESEDKNAPGTYFHSPFYFLLNVAVGGTYTGIMDADGITCFKDGDKSLEVDWIRVYQKDDDETAQYYYTDEKGQVQTNIEPEKEPDPIPDNTTQLSGFASKALEDGESTFDWDNVEKAVGISLSDGVRGHLFDVCGEENFWNYYVDNNDRNLYIWDDTYISVTPSNMTNSFGWDEGYNKFMVPDGKSWSGAGFNYKNCDFSMIDDTWYLHFALRGVDQKLHANQQIQVGNAHFYIGASDGALASIGDYKRDGEWYYFDIPVSALKQLCIDSKGIFDLDDKGAVGIFSFLSGNAGHEIMIDNIFFYKSKKEIPTFSDSNVNLGQFGYKTFGEDGEPIKKFDKTTVAKVAPLYLDNTTRQIFTGNDSYNADENVVGDKTWDFTGDNNYFVWGNNSMWADSKEGLNNPLGIETEPYPYWHDNDTETWNGYGIIGQQSKDFSMIDDTYYLHIDLMSEEAVAHIPVTVGVGNSSMTFGSYSKNYCVGDFGRDGQWYSFDIPVSELKQCGTLFEDTDKANQKKNAWADNFLTFSTGAAQYYNPGFAIGNVFFWQPANEEDYPEVAPELGKYTTKSLDEDGNSYFSFKDRDFIPFAICTQVYEMMKQNGYPGDESKYSEDNIVLDCRPDVNGGHFYIWDGTYASQPQPEGVMNSFGGPEGWINLTVGSGGWSGAGFVVDTDGVGADMTILEDGNWHLHFAMRAKDETADTDHEIGFGEAKFTIGAKKFSDEAAVVLGNFKRDGEWYSFDIPYSVLKQFNSDLFKGTQSNYTGNLFWFMSGGVYNRQCQIDNVFMWRDKSTTGIDTPTVSEPKKNVVTGIFDISGRKVQNMSKPGLYIIRTADKVKKVLVK